MTRTFDLQGHRGARGLTPENTLEGFEAALRIGVTTLETDLAVTRDNIVVLSHDPRLNPDITRRADGRWLEEPGPTMQSLTLAELQLYDIGRIDPATDYARRFPHQTPADGARIPTLAQLFALSETAEKPPNYNIEIKTSPLASGLTPPPETFARLVVETIRAAGTAERVTIQSFDWRALQALRELAPDIARSALTIDTPAESTVRGPGGTPSPWLAGIDLAFPGRPVPELVKAAGCGTWSPYWLNLDASAVTLAHGLGLKVLPWTVNEPADMAALIALGVDGLITDYPDRARAVMQQHGLPLPLRLG